MLYKVSVYHFGYIIEEKESNDLKEIKKYYWFNDSLDERGLKLYVNGKHINKLKDIEKLLGKSPYIKYNNRQRYL